MGFQTTMFAQVLFFLLLIESSLSGPRPQHEGHQQDDPKQGGAHHNHEKLMTLHYDIEDEHDHRFSYQPFIPSLNFQYYKSLFTNKLY